MTDQKQSPKVTSSKVFWIVAILVVLNIFGTNNGVSTLQHQVSEVQRMVKQLLDMAERQQMQIKKLEQELVKLRNAAP